MAEELHFGRAAARLHIAQPPLSQQIKRLEEELGAQLLRRTTRHVELTDAGKVFLVEARRALSAAERAETSARRASRGEVGWLPLGFVGSTAYEVLPSILRTFTSRSPEVRLDLFEMTTVEQLTALDAGQIDAGVVRDLEDVPTLQKRSLLVEPLVAAIPATHRFAERPSVGLRELAEDRFILFPRGRIPRVYDRIATLCRRAGFMPRSGQEAIQYPTIIGLVSAGLGVAVVPTCVQAFREPNVVYLHLEDRDAETHLSLVYRRDRSAAVLDRLEEACEAAGLGSEI